MMIKLPSILDLEQAKLAKRADGQKALQNFPMLDTEWQKM